MSVRLSLLALLDQGSCYGYQLRFEFERRTGSLWPLNVGQIYNTLDRLERDALVIRDTIDSENQIFYRITDAGSAEVAEWFGSAVPQRGPTRGELALKLSLAATLPGVDLSAIIAVQRAAVEHHLGALRAAQPPQPQSVEEFARQIITNSEVFAVEAELGWLDRCVERLAQASAGAVATLPLRVDPPKRGRPAHGTY